MFIDHKSPRIKITNYASLFSLKCVGHNSVKKYEKILLILFEK